MLIMMISDTILLAMVFYMTLFIPQPRDNLNIRNNIKPLIQIEKMTIDNYLLNNTLGNLDLSKEYSVWYDKTTGKFVLKDTCGKVEINSLWLYLGGSQSFGRKYCIKIQKTHPLEFQTTFTQDGLTINYK